MTCVDDLELGDYVDDALVPDRRVRVEAHLAVCPSCRSLASDLQSIRLTARALEPVEPPSHVWAHLSARLDVPARVRHRTARLAPFGSRLRRLFTDGAAAWQGFGAAAAAITLVLSLVWLGGRLVTVTDGVAGPGGGTDTALAVGMPWALEAAEAPLATAISGLERITLEQRDGLDPDVAAVLLANLSIIDDAIGQSREALAAEPESELVQASLLEALRQKVALLEDTVTLINVSSVREPRQ